MLARSTGAVVTISLVLLIGVSAHAEFWHSDAGAAQLGVDSTKALIMFESGFGTDQQELVLASIERIAAIIDDDMTPNGFVVCSLSIGDGYDQFLDSLDGVSGYVPRQTHVV